MSPLAAVVVVRGGLPEARARFLEAVARSLSLHTLCVWLRDMETPASPESEFLRRCQGDAVSILVLPTGAAFGAMGGSPTLSGLRRDYDLLVVASEATARAELDTWVGEPPVEEPTSFLHCRPSSDELARIVGWLEEERHRRIDDLPEGGLLVGGASRRMGRPKAALQFRGRSFEEIALAALQPYCRSVSYLGSGGTMALPRLRDAPGVAGPLAGIVAAMRWRRDVGWLIAACDLPEIGTAAVEWLLKQRKWGTWAVLPRVQGRCQPLLACYEPQSLALLESLALGPTPAPAKLQSHPQVATPEPPAELRAAWTNVNTPEDLARLESRSVAD